MKSKRGFVQALGMLPSIAIVILVFGLIVGIGAGILADQQDEYITGAAGCNATTKTACGVDYNATGEALDGVAELSEKTPTITKTSAAAIVLMVVLAAFGGLAYARR